jgi:hypothetical protein
MKSWARTGFMALAFFAGILIFWTLIGLTLMGNLFAAALLLGLIISFIVVVVNLPDRN